MPPNGWELTAARLTQWRPTWTRTHQRQRKPQKDPRQRGRVQRFVVGRTHSPHEALRNPAQTTPQEIPKTETFGLSWCYHVL